LGSWDKDTGREGKAPPMSQGGAGRVWLTEVFPSNHHSVAMLPTHNTELQ